MKKFKAAAFGIINLLHSIFKISAVCLFFVLRIIFNSDAFKQARYDVWRNGFSRSDAINADGIFPINLRVGAFATP